MPIKKPPQNCGGEIFNYLNAEFATNFGKDFLIAAWSFSFGEKTI